MKCPVCHQHELVAQSLEDSQGDVPDLFCPEIVSLPNNRVLNHYREQVGWNTTRIIVLPYRITTIVGVYSKIAILSQYKTGQRGYYFKTLLKTPPLHPDTPEHLLERIKLLLTLS